MVLDSAFLKSSIWKVRSTSLDHHVIWLTEYFLVDWTKSTGRPADFTISSLSEYSLYCCVVKNAGVYLKNAAQRHSLRVIGLWTVGIFSSDDLWWFKWEWGFHPYREQFHWLFLWLRKLALRNRRNSSSPHLIKSRTIPVPVFISFAFRVYKLMGS